MFVLFPEEGVVRGSYDLQVTEPASHVSEEAVTLLCIPGTMCSPQIFDGLRGLGLRLAVAPWLEWPGPHDIATLGSAVATLASRYSPVVLVGHSTGGTIALSAALRGDPGVVTGVVLCDSGANMHGHGDVDAIIERVRSSWGPALWAAIAERSVHTPLPEPFMTELVQYPHRITARAVEDVLRSQRDTDLQPELPRLAGVPALVVHGRHDTARTLAHAQQLADGLGCRGPVVLDCGHTPPLEIPETFTTTIHRWLHHNADGKTR